MDSPEQAPEGRDPHLWRVATARVAFRAHALRYVLVNALLVGIWFFTTPHGYFWPMWPMLGWGIGLIGHAVAAYRSSGGESPVEREYRKLTGGF